MSLRGKPARLGIAALGLLLASVPVSGAESDLSARLLLGYDSNPNRVSFDDGSTGGMFAEQRADADLRFRTDKRTQGFFDLGARQRLHESSLGDADVLSAVLSAGLAFRPVKGDRHSVLLRVGARGRHYDATFVDPETGQVFEYQQAAPGGGVTSTPVPDRFDYGSGSAFVDFRWVVNRRVRLSLDSEIERRDYSEDYGGAGLDSLDYRALTVEPGIRARLGRVVTLDATLPMTRREYDDRPALDADGNAVPGELREYEYEGFRFALTFSPTRSLKLRADVRRTDRADVYAGYYDSTADTAYLWLERKLGRRSELELYASRTRYDYDNATVPDDPTNLLRGGEFSTLRARFERSLGRVLRLYGEAGSQDADNQDAALAYDRRWVMTGIRFGN